MTDDQVFRVIEIVGTSSESVSDAIRNGVARASETLRHLDWFEVTGTRGYLKDGTVAQYQVQMKVGFKLE